MIALLSGFSQAFLFWEFNWQCEEMSGTGDIARQRLLDHSLSLAALAAQTADEPDQRVRATRMLEEAIRRTKQTATRDSNLKTASRATSAAGAALFAKAETHRQLSLGLADQLLVGLRKDTAGDEGRRNVQSLVRQLVAEQEAFDTASHEFARTAELASIAHLGRLKAVGLQLFALLLCVLILEGLFVINPAVIKIQRFLKDVERSNCSLQVYTGKLERSNKELQDFASVASHDLQEPLRKIQAFSDRLRSKYATSIDDQGRDYLDRIQNAAKRMQTLINDLLSYARVATKAQPFVSTDLVSLTHEVIGDLETRIEEVHGRVEVGELPKIDADPLQVRQLMQNLIGNSLKYSRTDVPPVVKISSKNLIKDPATPSFPLNKPVCQILIEDNGIGFDEVYTDRIFTIFQRLHGRNEYEGTGIGLAVCRKIVERHGGSITARSTPGTGSTFIVTLPLRQPKEAILSGRET